MSDGGAHWAYDQLSAQLGIAPRNMLDDTIKRASVVVTTLSNTGEFSLLKHFNPHVVILDEAELGLARPKPINDIIRKANVIVTTFSNIGESSLMTNFFSNVIILDEAARAVEPDMWNILGNYDPGMLRSL